MSEHLRFFELIIVSRAEDRQHGPFTVCEGKMVRATADGFSYDSDTLESIVVMGPQPFVGQLIVAHQRVGGWLGESNAAPARAS